MVQLIPFCWYSRSSQFFSFILVCMPVTWIDFSSSVKCIIFPSLCPYHLSNPEPVLTFLFLSISLAWCLTQFNVLWASLMFKKSYDAYHRNRHLFITFMCSMMTKSMAWALLNFLPNGVLRMMASGTMTFNMALRCNDVPIKTTIFLVRQFFLIMNVYDICT